MKRMNVMFYILISIILSLYTDEYRTVIDHGNGFQSVLGLVSPLDQEGKNFYLQNEDGLVEIKLKDDAQVGIMFREKNNMKEWKSGTINVSQTGKSFGIPDNLYVYVRFDSWRNAQKTLESGDFKYGFVTSVPITDHLPTESELWLSGKLTGFAEGKVSPQKILMVEGKEFTGYTTGYNGFDQLAGIFDHTAIKPFVNQAAAYGKMVGEVFQADYLFLRGIPDQTANDDPNLPRYLFIGDSISGNYDSGLREALKGKYNIHHPPTNCGPTDKGRQLMGAWLGDYKNKGRHWDVISFNFGHWNSGDPKGKYQDDLESIILQLKDTGAKLIWVTTCPVPNGYDTAGGVIEKNGRISSPGRLAGVMKKYINPWAMEIISKYPEISICDQWQFVKDHEKTIYKDFWAGKNVHFRGEGAKALGKFLAEHVEMVMK